MKIYFQQRRRWRGGQGLVEIMLAVSVFALAALGFANALNRAVDAAIAARRDAQIRMALESRMAEIRKNTLQQGTFDFDVPDEGIKYSAEIKLEEFANRKQEKMGGIYKVVVKAAWKDVFGDQSREATMLIYQP